MICSMLASFLHSLLHYLTYVVSLVPSPLAEIPFPSGNLKTKPLSHDQRGKPWQTWWDAETVAASWACFLAGPSLDLDRTL